MWRACRARRRCPKILRQVSAWQLAKTPFIPVEVPALRNITVISMERLGSTCSSRWRLADNGHPRRTWRETLREGDFDFRPYRRTASAGSRARRRQPYDCGGTNADIDDPTTDCYESIAAARAPASGRGVGGQCRGNPKRAIVRKARRWTSVFAALR